MTRHIAYGCTNNYSMPSPPIESLIVLIATNLA